MKEKFSLKPKEKPQPRDKTTITKEYTDLLGKVANAQYLVYVYSKETDQLNTRLLELNQEANQRDILDKVAKEAESKEQNVKA